MRVPYERFSQNGHNLMICGLPQWTARSDFLNVVEILSFFASTRSKLHLLCYCGGVLRENREFVRSRRGIHLFFSCIIRRRFWPVWQIDANRVAVPFGAIGGLLD